MKLPILCIRGLRSCISYELWGQEMIPFGLFQEGAHVFRSSVAKNRTVTWRYRQIKKNHEEGLTLRTFRISEGAVVLCR